MKNGKLSALLNTPMGTVAAVAAVVLGTELLFMALLHEFLIPMLPFISHTAWDVINAVTTTALVSPVLYFLVFRPLIKQQAELEDARKKINEAFQEWMAALDAVNDPIFLHDKDFRILRCNKAYQQCAGLPFKQIIGQPYYEIFPKNHAPLPSCQRAMEKEEEEEVAVGGAIYRSRAFSIKDEQGAYLYSVHTLEDITISRRAEVALHESEEKFRKITESAQDAIIMMGADRRISLWNTAATRIFGYTSEEALGKEMHTLIAPPQAYAAFAQGFTHFQATGEGPVIGKVIEVSALRKGGEEFPVELSISATQLGGQWHAIGIVRDITERKRTEAAFRTLIGIAATNIGAAFFHETVSGLSTWLGVECVIVGEIVDENRVQALAMQLDGKAIEHYEYALPGTPCDNVAHKGYCEYPEGVCQLFPSDKDLSDMGAEAYVGTPIRDKNGKAIGVLCVISRHKLVSPPMLKGVFEIIAARAGTEIERKQAEQALHESEKLYRSLFENMLNGFAYCQMIFEQNQPQDFIYLSVNAAFETLTGLKNVAGKRVSEVIPGIRQSDPGLFEMYGRVSLSGKPEQFEIYLEALQQWFWISVYSPEKGYFVAVFDVITERKRTEAQLTEQLEELRGWHDVTLGREMRVLELKHEVDELLAQAGQPPRYPNAEQE